MKASDTYPDVASLDATPAPVDDVADTGGSGQVPISVAEGDFSTPSKRKRTITRPRGLRTLEQPSTPSQAETPPHAVISIPVAVPGPSGDVPGHEASAVDEFLAAPPTPEPELTQTPAPESVLPLAPDATPLSSAPVGAIGGFAVEGQTDAIQAAPAEAIENLAAAAEMRQSALAGEGRENLADDTGGESHKAVGDHPDPEQIVVDNLLEQATAQLLTSADAEVVNPDVVAFDEIPRAAENKQAAVVVASAVSAEGGLSPLAQTLANMAEAMQGDIVGDEDLDIDIVDAPLVALPAEALLQGHVPEPRTKPPRPPADDSHSIEGRRSDGGLPVPPLVVLPEALAERPRRPKRSKPWFEEVFDESYLRTLPFMTADQTLREVDFIESSLAVAKGGEVLDIACGYGRHAIELVQRGLSVTGLDLSLPLLIRAADESQRREVSVNFVHTDMREMSFERQFSGAYCMLTSFGYFDEESNLKVAEGIARALKPGGRLLIDVVNRDYIVGDLPARVWWEGEGCVVLEEVDFNFNTNRILTHRSVVFEDGQQLEQEISVRVYSLHELGKLLRQAGFRVIEVSGSIPTRGHFFGANSRNLLVLAERRSD